MQTYDQWSLITTTFSILSISSLLQLTCMHRFIWSPYVFVTIISRPPVSYWCVWRQASSVKGLVFMKSVPEARNRGLFSRRFIPAALVVGLKVHWPVTLSAVGVLLLDNSHQKPFNPTPPGDSNSNSLHGLHHHCWTMEWTCNDEQIRNPHGWVHISNVILY